MTDVDVAEGYRALAGGSAAVELDRDVIQVSGPDAITYLQGQLSQDIEAVEIGRSAWSLVLQPQGKVDAWVRVTRTAVDRVILDVDAGWGGVVVTRLSRFKLRTKADIEALHWRCVAVRGPLAPRHIDTGADAGADGDVAAGAEWPLIGGCDILGPAPAAPAGVPVVSLDAYEVRRIEAGLPRMGAELTDRTIPAEAGVVERSVSFTKGCYTGQELVARIDSRGGHVPRLLRGVVLHGEMPPIGTAIEIAGRDAGTLTSVARHPDGHGVGLASVRRDVDPPAEGTCAGAAVSIRTLPLVS